MRADANDFLIAVREEYENRVGEKVEDTIRKRNHVEHRCAIANALRPFSSYATIGGLFNKDHSTIVHYHREHEPMLHFQPEYRRKYAVALEVMEHVCDKYDVVPIKHTGRDHVVNPRRRIEDIERVIMGLHMLRDRIINHNFPQD
jgi:hypothetical protein